MTVDKAAAVWNASPVVGKPMEEMQRELSRPFTEALCTGSVLRPVDSINKTVEVHGKGVVIVNPPHVSGVTSIPIPAIPYIQLFQILQILLRLAPIDADSHSFKAHVDENAKELVIVVGMFRVSTFLQPCCDSIL
jgi:hypothetical protein